MTELGAYGGRVLRAFNADTRLLPGHELAPDEVAGWPEANRRILATSGCVEWYAKPEALRPKRSQAARPVEVVPSATESSQ